MNESHLKDTLSAAEQHYSRYEWDQATTCFEQALAAAPEHDGARQGLTKSRKKKDEEAQILEQIAAALASLDARAYDQALLTLDQAYGLSATSDILKHVAEIDRLRSQTQERVHWRDQVKRNVDRAKRQAQEQDANGALRTLDTLLNDLATAGFPELGDEARRERDRLLQGIAIEDKIQRAQAAFDRQDYQLACKLAEELQVQAAYSNKVRVLHTNACERWEMVATCQQQAQGALDEGRLEDAVALLRKLKDDDNMKHNPNWQGLWLKGYTDRGRERIETGRQALQRREAQSAVKSFAEARQAFDAVLEVFPAHQTAEPARNEADALQGLAVVMNQAQTDLEAKHWETARANLNAAQDQRKAAEQMRGNKFGDVEAVLTAILGEVQGRLTALESARAWLKEGEDKLQERQPDKAEAAFREGLRLVGDLDARLQEELVAALRRADCLQSEVTHLIERAQASSDMAERVTRLADAHSRWPGAPGMPDVRAKALLEAGAQAQDAGSEARAAEYFATLFSLEGVSTSILAEAHSRQNDLGAEQRARAALNRAQEIQAEAIKEPVPREEVYQQVVELLGEGEGHVRGITHTGRRAAEQNKFAEARQTAEKQLRQVQQALQLRRQAENARREGDWEQAVDRLQQAVAALDDIQANEWRQTLRRWQKLAGDLATAQQKAGAVLSHAEVLYQAGSAGDLQAVNWDGLDAALKEAEAALLPGPPEGEPPPAGWATLAEGVADLRKRHALLRRVRDEAQADQMKEALADLRVGKSQWPADAVLASVYDKVYAGHSGRLQAEASRLLAEAQEQFERGDMGEAMESLRQVRELSPTADVSAQARRLQRQSEIWEEITRLDIEGNAKRQGGSLDEAQAAFEKAIQKAIEADAGLPVDVRRVLSELLGLRPDLHKDEEYHRSQVLRDQMREFALQYPIVQQRLLSTVLSWHDLSARAAREVYIRSQVALNKLEDAYESAVRYLYANPTDNRAMQLTANIRGQLKGSVQSSAQKRLGYARELMEKGAYAQAQEALGDIESKWLGLVEARFPEVLASDPDIEAIRKKASDLGLQVQHLIEVAAAMKELPGHIRSAYIEGDLEEAERLIAQAGGLDTHKEATLLWKDIDELRAKVVQTRQQRVRKEVEEALHQANSALDVTETEEDLQNALSSLANARTRVSQVLTGPEDERLRQLLPGNIARVQSRLEQLQGVQVARHTAEAALQQDTLQELQVAHEALSRVLPTARGTQLEEIRIQLNRLEHKITAKQDERQQTEVWQAAVLAFEARDYERAKLLFGEAQSLGRDVAEVAPYTMAIRLARKLHEIVALMEFDLVTAKSALAELLRDIENCPPAVALRQEAEQRLADLVERIHRNRLQQLQAFLEDAGFDVRTTDEWGFICTSNLPFWSDVSPLLARLQSRPIFDSVESQLLCSAAENTLPGVAERIAIVATERFPDAGELHQVFALKAQKRLSVVPVPATDFSRARSEGEASRRLHEQIALSVGREDMYDFRLPLPALTRFLSFFGRQAVLTGLLRNLATSQSTIIFGMSKVGKTSLLWRLQEESAWPTAYVGLFGFARGLSEIYPAMLHDWWRWLEAHYPTKSLPVSLSKQLSTEAPIESTEFKRLATDLLDFLASLPERPGLAVLLDESTVLDGQDDYFEFAGVLQSLVEDPNCQQRFFLVLCGINPQIARIPYLDETRKRRNPFGGKFKELPLGCLAREDARNMIVSIGQQMDVVYDEDALELLLDYGGGHPFLTRQLCSRTIHGLPRPIHVQQRQVVRAVRQYLDDPNNYLATVLWNKKGGGPPPGEAELLHALAQRQPQSKEEAIPLALTSRQRSLRQEALGRLIDNSLIVPAEFGYQFSIPLYREWIRRSELNLRSDREF